MSDTEEPPMKVTKLDELEWPQIEALDPEFTEEEMGEMEVLDDGQEEWLSEGAYTDDDYPMPDGEQVDSKVNTSQELDDSLPSMKSEHLDDSLEKDSTPPEIESKIKETNIEETLNNLEGKEEDLPEDLDTFLIRKTDGVVLAAKIKEEVTKVEKEDDGNDTDDLLRMLGEGDEKAKKKVLKNLKVKKEPKKEQSSNDDDDDDDDGFVYEGMQVRTVRVARHALRSGPAARAQPEDSDADDDTDASSDEVATMQKMFGVKKKLNVASKSTTKLPMGQQKKPTVKLVKQSIPVSNGHTKKSTSTISLPVKTREQSKSILKAVTPKPELKSNKKPTVSFKQSPTLRSGSKPTIKSEEKPNLKITSLRPDVTSTPKSDGTITPKSAIRSDVTITPKSKSVGTITPKSDVTITPKSKSVGTITPKSDVTITPKSNMKSTKTNVSTPKSEEKPLWKLKPTRSEPNAKLTMKSEETPASKFLAAIKSDDKPVIKSEKGRKGTSFSDMEHDEIIDEEEFLDDDEFDLDEDEFDEESDMEIDLSESKQRIMRPERMDEEIPTDEETNSEDGSLYDELPSSESEDMDDWFNLDIRAERAGDYIPLLGSSAHKLLMKEKQRVTERLSNLRESLTTLTETGRKQAEQLKDATMSLAELDDLLKAS